MNLYFEYVGVLRIYHFTLQASIYLELQEEYEIKIITL